MVEYNNKESQVAKLKMYLRETNDKRVQEDVRDKDKNNESCFRLCRIICMVKWSFSVNR